VAAVIDLINETKFYHIVTIEDPSSSCTRTRIPRSSARAAFGHTQLCAALRAALRQAPKVILVGEMRDKETMEVALEAAETGHLVLSTLHTIDAAKTVERIIGVFPRTKKKLFARAWRNLSATSSRSVSCRAPTAAPGRGYGDFESNVADQGIHRTRRNGRQIAVGRHGTGRHGRHANFDGEIEKLVRAGVVNKEDGLAYSSNHGNLLLRWAS